MRAAVIRRSGATPALDQFADPQPGRGLPVGTLVAAALNPLDIATAQARGHSLSSAGWQLVACHAGRHGQLASPITSHMKPAPAS